MRFRLYVDIVQHAKCTCILIQHMLSFCKHFADCIYHSFTEQVVDNAYQQ